MFAARTGSWLLAAALLAVGRPAVAQEARQLDLDTTLRLAQTRSPELAAGRAAVRSSANVEKVGRSALQRPPRVELSAGPRYRGVSREYGLDATLALWQDFSLGGYGSARESYAQAYGAEAQKRLDVARREAAAQAGLAWIDARLAREIERIRRGSLNDARELLRIAKARVRVGQSAPSEEALASSLLGSARARLLMAEGRRVSADAELCYLLGLPPEQPLETVGALDAPDLRVDAQATHRRALLAHPGLVAARARAETRERAAGLALSAGKPFLSVGPSVTREGTGDWIVQGRVAFPLQIVNPNALEAAQARSEAAVARAQVSRARARLERDLRLALHERKHAREARDALATGAVVPAREALRQAKLQYEVGSAELPLVLGARRELDRAQERWAEAAADVRRSDVQLMRIAGETRLQRSPR